MNKYVAILSDGIIEVHFPDVTGNYATLCGMDGNDDDPMVDQHPSRIPKGQKVNCKMCIGIYDVTHKYTEKDIDR
jgi:hypothetical protein